MSCLILGAQNEHKNSRRTGDAHFEEALGVWHISVTITDNHSVEVTAETAIRGKAVEIAQVEVHMMLQWKKVMKKRTKKTGKKARTCRRTPIYRTNTSVIGSPT